MFSNFVTFPLLTVRVSSRFSTNHVLESLFNFMFCCKWVQYYLYQLLSAILHAILVRVCCLVIVRIRYRIRIVEIAINILIASDNKDQLLIFLFLFLPALSYERSLQLYIGILPVHQIQSCGSTHKMFSSKVCSQVLCSKQ